MTRPVRRRRPVRKQSRWLRIPNRNQRGIKSWNFWTPITGTVYRLRAHHPVTGRLMRRAYIGRTMQVPWTRRIEGHLWGTRDTPAQPWADTVPGWRPNGTVEEVVAAGGAAVIVQFRMVPLILTWLEFAAIVVGRPKYNVLLNRGNRRRIPKWKAVEQRRERDARRGSQPWGAPSGRWVRQVVGAVLVVAGVLVLASLAAMA